MNMSKILTSAALVLALATISACADRFGFETEGHPQLDCPEGEVQRKDVRSHNYCIPA